MNGQDHAREAERLLEQTGDVMTEGELADPESVALTQRAYVHATLAVAYAQAGAWKDIPSPQPTRLNDPENRLAKIATHIRESTDYGPDYCKPCSEAIGEWVPWPCAGSLTSGPCGEYVPVGDGTDVTCVRARGHDGQHVTSGGHPWP